MTIKSIITIGLLACFGLAGRAQNNHTQTEIPAAKVATDSFWVNGNCGMCQRTIQKAALSVMGVRTAAWDKVTHQLVLTYTTADFTDAPDPLIRVKKAVAASGYDTKAVKADGKAYKALPGCCQYER